MDNQLKTKKTEILFIYKPDQDWQVQFQKLQEVPSFNIVFLTQAAFDLNNIENYKADIIVLPLSLAEAKALDIAKEIHSKKITSTKLLLCSDSKVKKELILKVFDSIIERTGIRLSELRRSIEKLHEQEVKRIKDDFTLEVYIDAIIANESCFTTEEHGGKSLHDVVYMKDSIKRTLRYYLLFILITMVATLYPVADTLYKQFVNDDLKDHTVLWVFIMPFIWPFIYTFHHHTMGEPFNKKEKYIYITALSLELILIIFFIIKQNFNLF